MAVTRLSLPVPPPIQRYGAMGVSSVAELLVLSGSFSLLETIAVLAIWPDRFGSEVTCTTICTVALPPFARVSRLQVRFALPLQLPGVVGLKMGTPGDKTVAETSATSEGSLSLTATLVASDGPRFTTVTV